ncbi:unnamed protein product [Musa textilis]
MSCREGLMSPQTETKASVGFKAGVKDYKLTYYTRLLKSKILISWQHSVTPQPGVPPEQAGCGMPNLLLVHGQLCGLMDLPVLIVTKGDATTSRPLLGRKINILLM